MFCSKCGVELEENSKFCGECGAAVVEESVARVRQEPINTGAGQTIRKALLLKNPKVAIIIVCAVLAVLIFIVHSSGESSIVGTWYCADEYLTAVFKANGEYYDSDGGTGSYTTNGSTLDLNVSYSGHDKSREYTYVVDGDTLTLKYESEGYTDIWIYVRKD